MTTTTPPRGPDDDPFGTPPLFDPEPFTVPGPSVHFSLTELRRLTAEGKPAGDVEVHLGRPDHHRSLSGWCLSRQHRQCPSRFPSFRCWCECHQSPGAPS